MTEQNDQILAGRVILVTGAGYGIGREAALTYARAGATVLLLGRTQEALNDTYDLIEAENLPQAAVLPFDLEQKDEDPFRQLAALINENFDHLDGVLLNASVLGQRTTLENYDFNTWQKVMQINVNGQFALMKHLLPLLRSAPADASVIFTTSSVGREGRAYWGAYSVSKFATEGLMQVMAQELENTSQVRVNSINPGATRTTMRAAAYPAEDPATVTEAAAIMPLYLHLMSPASIGTHCQSLDAQPK
ncbi:MAG: YciK family oxidoreductase [Thalassolituus sp.]|jgi:NAD(P)-dependent dehydrogenase (short-subunit alcohol dehydrogenase family)|uniref:Oxidoreductase, short-chain dehydrogenase/reductase family n=1 Tax=hydrothermal vent metagenome TaxID=652676 RepID=A0A160TCL0_9ZZZZ|nr:YciK family oxidoreductase [Thalassolituus oleivorans]AHK15490.1 oxoacyl-ACP reductase [Thalassolituus oleivorans R6-15]APR66669.1 YciK family oxidoreductase [Thalassolituus oleivorans]MBQ0725742.1 YciK family oxidoreductase [Thalassolituus oleivorans]MBQ0781057.1 YciK family oxidoreductase [Thalassolituus oleivorans]MCA6127399.1 3-oxoacyl-ACP reductase [Thalassolituus oleivorans 4BN06-13]